MSAPAASRRLPWYVWALLALVVLIGGAAAALVAIFPPARVRAVVQQQLSTTLAREVRFSDARLGFWPPVRITVSEPALAEPGGFANGTAFRARSLNLDLDLLGLLARRLVVRRLVLDEPALHLVLRADGTTNLDHLGPTPAPSQKAAAPAPLDLAVTDFRVRRGQVLVDDLKASKRTAFGVETTVSFGLDVKAARVTTRGSSRISDLAFGPLTAARASDLNHSLSGLQWRIEHQGAYELATRRLVLQRLGLLLGSAELGFSGTADLASQPPTVDLRARGSAIDLGQVLSYLSSADAPALKGIQGAGRLDFDLAVRGAISPGTRPAVTGALSVRDGSLRYPRAPVGLERASFTARIAPDSLSVSDFTASVSGQPVRGRLGVQDFADPRVAFAIDGQVDLAAIGPLIAPANTQVGGHVALDVSGRGRAKDPAAMAVQGWAKLNGVSLASPSLPRPVEQIGGEIDFSPAVARVKSLSAKAGMSSFTLDAEVQRPLALLPKPAPAAGAAAPRAAAAKPPAPAQIDFSLASPYLDLAELLPPTPGGPLLPNARGQGKIAIARLKNQKLDVRNLNARVELTPTQLTVPQFSCNAYGGAVHGEMSMGLTDPAQPQLDLKAAIDSAQASEFLSTWTGAGKLFKGVLGTTLQLSASGLQPQDILRSLTAQGVAQFANGTIGPAPVLEQIAALTRIPSYREVRFTDCRTPFHVENGRVFTGPAKLVGSYGEWQIAGAVGFDGSLDYAASITVPQQMVASLGAAGALAAGALADDQGRVLIDLKISGTAKSPRIGWDDQSMRARLAGRVSQALSGRKLSLKNLVGDSLATRLALPDSAAGSKQAQRALEDTLKKVGRDLLKNFFGGGKSAPKDTTQK